MKNINYWSNLVRKGSPSLNEIRAYNRFINSTYANFYLSNEELFQWAGMASLSSTNVGIILSMLDYAANGRINILENPSGCDQDEFFMDMEVVRQGNLRIFNNVAWSFKAYQIGGFDAVHDAFVSSNVENYRNNYLYKSFDFLHQAENTNVGSIRNQIIKDSIWNLFIQEQKVVLQSYFDSVKKHVTWELKALLFGGTKLDFDGDLLRENKDYTAVFRKHAMSQWWLWVFTLSRPSFFNYRLRMSWIKKEVIVKWNKARNRSNDDLREVINGIAKMKYE